MEYLCPSQILETKENFQYGKVEKVTYFSKTCGMERAFNILYPVHYDANKKYPVFYMIHGIFGDENSFTNDENLHIKELFGNFALEDNSKEMFVVFPNMFATKDNSIKPDFTEEAVNCYDNFINELTADLMPYVENHFNVKTGRENTYICGFSLGGRETLFITISKPELADYVCAIAPAPGLIPTTDIKMKHKGQLSEADIKYSKPLPKVLIVCCGTNDSVVGKYPLSYHKLLEQNGTEHLWYEVPGADHDLKAIQSGVYNFLKLIFK